MKRSEIEQKRLQKLREEEKVELQSKSKSSRTISSSSTSSTVSATTNITNNTNSKSTDVDAKKTPPPPAAETLIDDLVLPRLEVIRRLRFLKQPITLFGEDDDSRLGRLKTTMKSGVLEIDSDMLEGQTNDFLRDIYELQKRQKIGSGSGSFLKRKRDNGGERIGGEDRDGGGRDEGGDEGGDDNGDEGMDGDDGNDAKRMSMDFHELCDEDKILVFFKRLLNEWNQELRDRSEGEKRTAKGKSMFATFKQCARYLIPLFKFCRKKVTSFSTSLN